MSSEQNVSEASVPQAPPSRESGDSGTGPGMGQSKSSRRRRRKRKGGPEMTGDAQLSNQSSPGTLPAVQAQAPQSFNSQRGDAGSFPREQFQPREPRESFVPRENFAPRENFGPRDGFNGGQNGTAKRWKKRFRDRDRPRDGFANSGGATGNSGFSSQPQTSAPSMPRDTNTHQFGNRADGFKRKSSSTGGTKRDRGPRGFVGPMDHSYRALHGAVEHSPSTIDTSLGWSRSHDSSPMDYSQGRVQPIDENAPSRIYLFIEDLFFYAKINETTRKLGVKVTWMKNDKEAIADLLALEEDNRPGLIVFDLNNASTKPMTLIPKLKAKFKRHTSIIGFMSQLQGELRAKAVEAGCDTVMPRSAFSQNLPNLLRRYGIEDEQEEDHFNS